MTVSDLKDLTELIKGLAWPIVALIVTAAFWSPLRRLLGDLPARVTKLTVFDFSIEFATLSFPRQPWDEATEASILAGGAAFSTTIGELFRQMRGNETWDYLVVDIEGGTPWFLSRLFLFSVMLQCVRGLKCVVFVHTTDKYYRRFIGLAEPAAVRIALARKYPWLEQTLIASWAGAGCPFLSTPLPKETAQKIVDTFMQDNRIQVWARPESEAEWTQYELNGQPAWEHTQRLDFRRFNDALRDVCYTRDARFVDFPETPESKRNRTLSGRSAPFIALVNEREEFRALVSRQALVDRIVGRLRDETT